MATKLQEAGARADEDLFPRIARLREQYFTHKPSVCIERALAYTEVFQETEGEPVVIRRAKGLKRTCETKTILIQDDELIVGNAGRKPRTGVLGPEMSNFWFDKELDTLSDRPQDPYLVDEEQKALFREQDPPLLEGQDGHRALAEARAGRHAGARLRDRRHRRRDQDRVGPGRDRPRLRRDPAAEGLGRGAPLGGGAAGGARPGRPGQRREALLPRGGRHQLRGDGHPGAAARGGGAGAGADGDAGARRRARAGRGGLRVDRRGAAAHLPRGAAADLVRADEPDDGAERAVVLAQPHGPVPRPVLPGGRRAAAS